MFARIVCVMVGYLFGCLLTAELVSRRAAGKSAFDLGDGNPGMANIGRELGTPAALACLAGDILKTLVPVLIMSRVFPQLGWLTSTSLTGLGATLGHIFPFWHGFRGGKGVATIASTIILINPFWGILTAVIGAVSIVVTGYLSAAAVVGMVFYTIASMFFGAPEPAIVSLIFLALTVYAHWSKLRGIFNGTTERAGLAKKFRRC